MPGAPIKHPALTPIAEGGADVPGGVHGGSARSVATVADGLASARDRADHVLVHAFVLDELLTDASLDARH